jgi:hypothetical protein
MDREDRFMKTRHLIINLLSTLWLLVSIHGPTAMAQTQTAATAKTETPSPSGDGWHVAITPYIWFAGVHGTVGALDHEASVHASFGDIFNYLNIGAMAAVEPRYNRIVMPFDFMWMKLSDNKALPFDEGATSVKAKMTETLITQKIGYRFVDQKRFKVDALFGFRYWHLENTFTLQPTQIANGISQSANWVDGLGGGRIELGLTPKLFATVMGDAGGGSAKLDYQVAGLLGYTLNRKLILLAGYRYLAVDYRPTGKPGFIYDVAMPGLVLGLTINVK